MLFFKKTLAITALALLFQPVIHAKTIINNMNDVTVSARLMLQNEYKSRFYPLPGAEDGYKDMDLNAMNIYPIALSITNHSDKPMQFDSNKIVIKDYTVLTAKSLTEKIESLDRATLLMAFLFFPLAFATVYQANKFKQLLPLVTQFGIQDKTIIINQEESYETVLFALAESRTQKDEDGKDIPATISTNFDIMIPLEQATIFNICLPNNVN